MFSGQKYPGSIHCQQLVFSFILLNYEKFHRVNKPACAQMLVCRGWPNAFQIGLEFGKSDSFFVVHSQCQWSSGSPWPSSKARLFSSCCRLAGPSKSRLTLRRESRREATGGTPLGSYVYKHSVFIQFFSLCYFIFSAPHSFWESRCTSFKQPAWNAFRKATKRFSIRNHLSSLSWPSSLGLRSPKSGGTVVSKRTGLVLVFRPWIKHIIAYHSPGLSVS